MPTAVELKRAGFNDAEIAEHIQSKSKSLLNAGFSQQEIAEHFGTVRPVPQRTGAISISAAEAPGIIGRARRFITDKTGLLAPDISPIGPKFREERPFRALGQLGIHHGAETLSGLGLRIPDILAKKITGSDTLAEALDKLTGFVPSPRDIGAGEAAKFIVELRTIGAGITPVIAKIPTRAALQTILSAGLTFGTRRANEEIAKKIISGKPIDWQGIHFEGGVGVLFGAGEVGISKFAQFVKGFRRLPKTQIPSARAEVNAALKHYKATGDRARWDAVRIKYAGITPEGVQRIQARTPPLPVEEFGKFPLAKRPVRPPAVMPAAKPEVPAPVKVFHGTGTIAAAKIKAEGVKAGKPLLTKKGEPIGNLTGFSVSKSSKAATEFGDTIVEFELSPEAKIATPGNLPEAISKGRFTLQAQENAVKLAKEKGFDAIDIEAFIEQTGEKDIEQEIQILNPDILISKLRKPPAPAVAKPKPVTKMATKAQKAKVHIIAKEKGFLGPTGKTKPQYRRLAKAMTGQTSIAKMTKEQASDFINAITKLPEPRMIRGRLVPPSIPITTRLARRGQFQQIFKEPTPISIITDPSFYATKLGVKSLVEPLEKAKQDFDFEYRKAAFELDRQGVLIDKVGKTTSRERFLAKVKNIPTNAREEMGRLLDKYETAPTNLAPEKARIFNYFRGLSRTILTRQNEARTKLGWPTIPSRKAYQRHIATDISKEMLAGKYPFPEGVKFWSGINTGEKVFNPMEFRRKLENDVYDLFVKDPVRASKAMMHTALKEIHLNQPLKFYKQQLNALGKDLPEYKNLSARERTELDKTMVIPASTRRWLTEYVNTTILGRQSKVDELVNNIVTKSGMKGVFNKVLAPFGRIVGRKPITDFFRRVGRAQMAGVLGPRPRIIIRNKFQLSQNLALYTNKANARAFGPPNKELEKLLEQSRFLRDYTGLEDLPVDIASKIEKLWHSAYQWSAKSNARQAMEVAYWDTRELIDNPKYKKHGWKPEYLLKEMEFGASATQFHYHSLGMPQIFRHRTLLPMTRLTSWWMNYFSKFHREAIHRALTGRPSWAGSEGPTLPWSRRLGWLRYVVLGGAILNTMGYTKSYLFGAAPTGWPPGMQFAWNAYLYTVARDEKQKALAKKKMWNAGKTFIPGYIAFKDFEAVWTGRKDLSSLLFYKKKKLQKPE